MIVPYSCDAPLYHLPLVTVGLIVTNTLLFFAVVFGGIADDPTVWMLEYGTGLHPIQWIASIFMHRDFWHLLGNMLFLWVFGIVVEGKIGWWRFLACYLAIGVGQSMIEQMLMLGYSGLVPGSLGASSAIYGLMAMACLWAPVNNISVLFVFTWFLYVTFDVTVGIFAAFYVGIDLTMVGLSALLGGLSIGDFLHLMGALIGGALGFVMLKQGTVDCEDYDLLSYWSGEYGAEKKRNREAVLDADPTRIAAIRHKKMLEGQRKFEAYLEIGQPEQSLAVRRRMIDQGMPLEISREQLLALIVALHKQHQWATSAPVMAELLERFPEDSQAIRLKLAQICLMELEKPNRALELLKPLDRNTLAAPHQKLFKKIVVAAKHQINEGVVEIDNDEW